MRLSRLFEPRYATVLALLIVLAGVVLRMIYPGTIYFNIHAERDLWRTIQILQGDRFPYTGSELTQGGYTPGPALYLLQIPPVLFSLDPRGLLIWLAILHGFALFLTFRIGLEHFSAKVGLAATALFATYPLAVLALRYLWNPSYIFPLSALFYWGLMDWVLKRRPGRLPWVVLAMSLLIQIHVSALALLLLFIVCAAVYRPPVGKRTWAISAGVFLLAFAPYIIGEARTGMRNTRLIFNPPDALTTANGAVIPLREQERVKINFGAMKALQVALSPVLYDRRYETGSFSYMDLLGEFGPMNLPGWAWRLVFLLHQLRWGYIAIHFLMGALLVSILARGKLDPFFADESDTTAASARQKALFFLLVLAITVIPPIFTATMVAPKDGKKIGIGAIRYYFVYYPMPPLMLALAGRFVTRLLRRWMPRGAEIPTALAVAGLCLLQTFSTLCFFITASRINRSFSYSFHETYDWTTMRKAADHLVNEWGITPKQFAHRMGTLDHTFDSTRSDVPSLEQSLDYAYFTSEKLDVNAPPKYPNAYVYIFDSRRTTIPELNGIKVLKRYDAGGLILLLSDDGPEREHSPIQNTWEKLWRPKRLMKE